MPERGGNEFESRSGLNFSQALTSQLLKLCICPVRLRSLIIALA